MKTNNMSKVVQLSIFLLGLMGLNQTHADEVATPNLNIKALIFESGCTVVATNNNIDVKLGKWATSSVKNVGDRTRSIPFSVQLKDCGTSISVSFNGAADLKQPELLALEQGTTAKNVAVEILDQNLKRVPVNTLTIPIKTTNSSVTLNFFANYYTTQANVTAGSANAVANLVISYE